MLRFFGEHPAKIFAGLLINSCNISKKSAAAGSLIARASNDNVDIILVTGRRLTSVGEIFN